MLLQRCLQLAVTGEIPDALIARVLQSNSKQAAALILKIRYALIAQRVAAENKYQLFVPDGFAHGFLVLSDEAIVSYKVDNFYVDFFGRNTTCCVDSIFKVF